MVNSDARTGFGIALVISSLTEPAGPNNIASVGFPRPNAYPRRNLHKVSQRNWLMNKYLLSGLLVLIVLVLMWQDTVDNIGTASPFDPNELVPTGTTIYTIFSHEQFVVFF